MVIFTKIHGLSFTVAACPIDRIEKALGWKKRKNIFLKILSAKSRWHMQRRGCDTEKAEDPRTRAEHGNGSRLFSDPKES